MLYQCTAYVKSMSTKIKLALAVAVVALVYALVVRD